MGLEFVKNVWVLKLDMVGTTALAAMLLMLGYQLRKKVDFFERFCIPAPVIGGFAFSLLALFCKQLGLINFNFTTTLQSPFMIAFFTTVGIGGSLALMKKGGKGLIIYLVSCWFIAVFQNSFGSALASVLGAQAPLSTFARTDPAVYGYGLGTTGFATSLIIGVYLIAMIAGALTFPLFARRLSPRLTLMGASVLVGLGFLLFLPNHDTYGQVITNMVIVGLGSGALVAALPAAAASAAPASQTGVATGLTNSVKTVGGAIASCVFGIALLHGVATTAGGVEGTAGSLAGYFTVWIVCGVTALVAAVALVFVPKTAFTDRTVEAEVAPIR